MKISAVGINAYRQITNDAQANKKATMADGQGQTNKVDQIQIPGRENDIGSKLSIQLQKGSFIDMLTTEEKKALEIVFEKFRDLNIDSKQYNNNGTTKRSTLGNVVDVKL
jgi:hypothetical protein